MNVAKRIEIEKKVVRNLIREMKKAGWDAYAVDDGGDALEKCRLEKDVMDAVFAVEEAGIKFKKYVGGVCLKRSALIVLGNDGYDAIADYSLSNGEIPEDDFDAIMDGPVSAYCDKLEEECPA